MTPPGRPAIGFIGLGIMGGPMAANLIRAGFDVTGYNRSQPAISKLACAGAEAAGSIADTVAGADIVITMLPNTPDVQQVVLGSDGVLAHARRGTLLIDMSTIEPAAARDMAARGAASGVNVLDAPVSGGQPAAIEGTLSIMAGGDARDLERARPVLQALGGTIVHAGPSGSGQIVKAANQLIVAGIIELVAEAIVFLEAHQVDLDAAVQVLSNGLAGNRILDRKATAMLNREFEPGFRVRLHDKDLGIMLTAARQAGVVVPLGSAVSQLMASLKAQGYGDLDHSALLCLVDQLSGRQAGAPVAGNTPS